MSDIENLQLFENQPVRTAWNEEEEEWYFSVVDVIGVLTDQPDSRRAAKYWSVLKIRLKAEGNELTTNCSQLKLKATDGKRRLTDVANTEQLLRIIQSIPSKKAEPFKLWLAQVGRERIEETLDPELIAERLVATYERKGYPLGVIAGNARRDLELQLGRSVITSKNARQLNHVVKQMIEASAHVTEEEDSDNK